MSASTGRAAYFVVLASQIGFLAFCAITLAQIALCAFSISRLFALTIGPDRISVECMAHYCKGTAPGHYRTPG